MLGLKVCTILSSLGAAGRGLDLPWLRVPGSADSPWETLIWRMWGSGVAWDGGLGGGRREEVGSVDLWVVCRVSRKFLN